ncbi:hypothetical protein PIB30_016489 [Stylosanthes scabra]|uniref:GRF-type domain-containing protein n=1 Tax=Stylosanthes scabra TaxID=79078 RepID=A0ABU6Y7S4_9FABA|nr:hypothetical protein [Stylosanthes scabra]
MVMENGGVSSRSRGSAGGAVGRSERSSSSTQGVFLPDGVKDSDGVAPKCHCGVYVVLYMSRTSSNPNRLFFGCPFFKKAEFPHCRSFRWLDKHIELLARSAKKKCADGNEDVEQHMAMIGMENRVTKLEERVAAMEMKNMPNLMLVVCLFVFVIAVYVVWV